MGDIKTINGWKERKNVLFPKLAGGGLGRPFFLGCITKDLLQLHIFLVELVWNQCAKDVMNLFL